MLFASYKVLNGACIIFTIHKIPFIWKKNKKNSAVRPFVYQQTVKASQEIKDVILLSVIVSARGREINQYKINNVGFEAIQV